MQAIISPPESSRGQLEQPPEQAAYPRTGDNVFTADDYNKFIQGYKSQLQEHSLWIDPADIEGQIPTELEGTLLRNGPGLFEIGGTSIPQPLDGDGMISMFSIKDGRVHFRNKYVRTEALIKEQEAGRMLYRGAFSVGNPSGGLFFNPFDFTVKGIANTNVLHWGGKTLALYERDLPYVLSNDLETLGQTDISGTVDTEKKFFGAHFRIMHEADGTQRLIAFNFSEGPTSAKLCVWEYDDKWNMLHKTARDIKGAQFGFFHDMLATENYYIFLENPIDMNFAKLLFKYSLGKACLAECLEYNENKPTRIHLIPRPGKSAANKGLGSELVFETTPFFSFHHINAFEADNGKVVVDTCAMEGINFGNSFETGKSAFESKSGKGVATRLVINTSTKQVQRLPLMPERAGELPVVSPSVTGKVHRHSYLAASRVTGETKWGPQQYIAKLSVPPELGVSERFSIDRVQKQVWDAGRDQFAQEPVFVPRPNAQAEDDGWVLTMVYDTNTNRTYLAILDGQDVTAGPVAKVYLPHHIPFGIHGTFTPTYLPPSEGAAKEHRVYSIADGVSVSGRPKYS